MSNIGTSPTGGGANTPIVGPGGQAPSVVTPNNNIVGPGVIRPGGNIIGPGSIVGPGGENQLAKNGPSAIANALFGSGSLTASNTHLNGVQLNIQKAISATNGFNVPNVTSLLQQAQNYTRMANSLSGSQRADALNNAKAALNNAGVEMQKMGYGQNHKFQPMGFVNSSKQVINVR